MENRLILVDTSIFIDFYRKKHKEKTVWYGLLKHGFQFAVSAVTKYEIYAGATKEQVDYWNSVFEQLLILPFDGSVAEKAVEINNHLKSKRKQIDIADLFIAATATAHDLPISTLNRNHFERIDGLEVIG
ncbi:MAG: type II toxin-antitoxin system VapC family toxin [Bacteroidetes bacterium]|nr:MAG: type II toxin-antitoxin system VapC family toxin [Bacteroidota bacterium]